LLQKHCYCFATSGETTLHFKIDVSQQQQTDHAAESMKRCCDGFVAPPPKRLKPATAAAANLSPAGYGDIAAAMKVSVTTALISTALNSTAAGGDSATKQEDTDPVAATTTAMVASAVAEPNPELSSSNETRAPRVVLDQNRTGAKYNAACEAANPHPSTAAAFVQGTGAVVSVPVLDQNRTGATAAVVDQNRTGAKCVAGEAADPQLSAASYHRTGALRTKPGRGPRTLSLACSDKILKWTQIGCQVRNACLFFI
jgi:hypothetical protein